ncbi:hypothetical protein [Aquimarina algiphila]|uniref:hypothetical protein n=1 Tax=Aquimarina algiphila TaxID=2047982 RepID=UPI00232EE14C|nr:hypothetical protein [Aquimarina algiphila]
MPNNEDELTKKQRDPNRKPPPQELYKQLITELKLLQQQRQLQQLQQLDKDITQYLSDTRGYRNKILSRFRKKDLETDFTKILEFKPRLKEFFKSGKNLNLTSDQYDRMESLIKKLEARLKQIKSYSNIVNGVKPKKMPKKPQRPPQSSTDSFTKLLKSSGEIKTADLKTSGPEPKETKKKQRPERTKRLKF